MAGQTEPVVWHMDLAGESETAKLARDIVEIVGANDVITLSGDLGAGKSTFARALVRRIVGDDEIEVPSPTFTLMQIYEGPKFPIVHADLYRIKSPSELIELGWDEAAEDALVLVEWPDRLGDAVTPDRLDIAFYVDAERPLDFRKVIVTGHGAMAERLQRANAIRNLLQVADWSKAKRTFMLGDASTRAYERLVKEDGSRAILMISPPRPDGPPVRFGKPYSAIARLAEDIVPFIAMARALREQGLSAPQIYASDMENGLAILEDFGSEPVIDVTGPIPDRYLEAVRALAKLHTGDLPKEIPVDDSRTYRIPPYDMDALLIEIELLTEWYAPHVAKVNLASGAKATFSNLWRSVFHEIVNAPSTWTLRDYHSPNLIWLDGRVGIERVGVIDFQDCVLGPPAYDVASLLQDARMTVPDDLELKLLSQYARARKEADQAFDMGGFVRAYAIMGAQRATKILGIFARLDKRDGKSQYLAHIPRIEHYLAKGLKHPALADLKNWYKTHLPNLAGN
jgi:tRNA threonylcarbamoyl adenosine modification protein YjeE